MYNNSYKIVVHMTAVSLKIYCLMSVTFIQLLQFIKFDCALIK